ncbi:pyridoxamine 5'-phosphate oxidase family protein [Streptomyces sp. V4-01]|uniref:Pyridoxamine 5'-phosphate oxidase family protein n=1 Tax=Actinacidiphila polyblastidii TaxID=3110430 RepID=A0ABU7P5K6_9ACTN|nr:pyridoxamine 5'-phosphate oxidase family protein [Streptomyces sp. V4-01]
MSEPAMPEGTLDARYSDPRAEPSRWEEVREALDTAQTYWLTTVRADGRPHVTPLIAIWDASALHFSTGEREQKSRNLAAHRHVALTTGANALDEGLDVVLEGEATRVTDTARLEHLAAAWLRKYGEVWRYEVRDDSFWHPGGGLATVYAVRPAAVHAFRKGPTYAQTRWTLD